MKWRLNSQFENNRWWCAKCSAEHKKCMCVLCRKVLTCAWTSDKSHVITTLSQQAASWSYLHLPSLLTGVQTAQINFLSIYTHRHRQCRQKSGIHGCSICTKNIRGRNTGTIMVQVQYVLPYVWNIINILGELLCEPLEASSFMLHAVSTFSAQSAYSSQSTLCVLLYVAIHQPVYCGG